MLRSSLALLLMIVVCSGKSNARLPITRVRLLARQQAGGPPSPAPTGYPVAGVTPEIPFDLPPLTAKPDVAYLPPDNTYGPPPSVNELPPTPVYGPPDSSYLPPEAEATTTEEPEVEATVDEQSPPTPEPDVQQQPPNDIEAEDDEIIVAVDDDGSVISVSNAFDHKDRPVTGDTDVGERKTARLVFQRFPQGRRSTPNSAPVPARLIQMRRVAPNRLQMLPMQLQPQPQPRLQNFVFASRYTSW